VAAFERYFVDGRVNFDNFDFFIVMAACVGFVIYFLGGVGSDEKPSRNSQPHPDPDVQAMIDGRIDAGEYARRKAATPPGDGG
jgi:hypothetical protein